MKIDHLSVTLRHQLSGEKKSSLQHHKIQRIQIVHPIGLANLEAHNCNEIVLLLIGGDFQIQLPLYTIQL